MLTAIIVAAGSSRRMGFDKLFARLGERTVIAHSIDAFARTESVEEIVIVAHADRLAELQGLIEQHDIRKIGNVVAGGERRQDSVRIGLENIGASAEFVAIHDAARPLVRPELIERVYEAARLHGAAAAAAPVTDTLKRVDSNFFVAGGVERDGLYAMQTPQIFSRDLLERAYRAVFSNKQSVTDEVSAIELLSEKVLLVPNTEFNLKITYPGDLPIAELLLARHESRASGGYPPGAKI